MATNLLHPRLGLDLLVMKQVLSAGKIVRPVEQKKKMFPIVEQIVENDMSENQYYAEKEESWSYFLLPAQVEKIHDRREGIESKVTVRRIA